jgi:hypothetical protein
MGHINRRLDLPPAAAALLDDPLVAAMMRRDGVDPVELGRVLSRIARHLAAVRDLPAPRHSDGSERR